MLCQYTQGIDEPTLWISSNSFNALSFQKLHRLHVTSHSDLGCHMLDLIGKIFSWTSWLQRGQQLWFQVEGNIAHHCLPMSGWAHGYPGWQGKLLKSVGPLQQLASDASNGGNWGKQLASQFLSSLIISTSCFSYRSAQITGRCNSWGGKFLQPILPASLVCSSA